MTQEDIQKLQELITKRNVLINDSMNLCGYINSVKKKESYIFSYICNALSERQDSFVRDDNIFNRVIRENKELIFKCVCNIFEDEHEKISKLIEEKNAQIEAVKIDFGGKE